MATSSHPTDPSIHDLPRGTLVVAAVLIGMGDVLGLAGLAKAVAGASTGAWRDTELAKYSPRSERATN